MHKSREIPVYSIDRFNRGTQKNNQYQVEIFDKNRDFKVTYPHRHDDFYELLYVTQGVGDYIIDFQQYEIKPESIFFLSPGQIHELQLSEDVQGFIFLFTSAFYHFNKLDSNKIFEFPFFYTIGKDTPPLWLAEGNDKEALKKLFEQAVAENKQELQDKDDAVRALLDLILIACKRLYPVLLQEENFSKGKILVKRFKKLIEEKCYENLSVKECAFELSVTANHLSETVKRITGRTPTDLINDRQLMEIKRMLTHTELTVSEIAFKLNFSDQSYFSKFFKKLSGITPAVYRSKLSE